MKKEELKTIARNKKANHEYFILETYEGMHIAPYEKGNIFNQKEERERKLLLHKKEIIKLFSKVKLEGLTIIPLEVYILNGLCKVKIGLCKGKKLYDKRNDLKEKSAQKDIQKNMKVRY